MPLSTRSIRDVVSSLSSSALPSARLQRNAAREMHRVESIREFRDRGSLFFLRGNDELRMIRTRDWSRIARNISHRAFAFSYNGPRKSRSMNISLFFLSATEYRLQHAVFC